MSFLPSSDLHFLSIAQAAPAAAPAATPDEPTAGQALGGSLLLATMAASIWMSWVWANRRRATGHYLPVAQRGVLRVPLGLTAAGIVFAVLMLLMVMLSSLAPDDAKSGAATAKTSESKTEEPNEKPPAEPSSAQQKNAEAQDVTSSDKADAASDEKSASPPDLAKMRSMMWLNIQFEIFIFLMFGFFVWLHRVKGRATLHETPYVKKEVLTFADQERWPDLEDESLTPSDARLASSLDDAALQPASDLNPYLPPEAIGTSSAQTASITASGILPELPETEPFSLAHEIRFAGEVFLAAYLPTTMLRLVVVSLYTMIVGEDPGQHELLEMIRTGVDATLLGMIALTAVILAPIVEELQFRVVILGGLAQRGHTAMALMLSSILFGLVHGIPDGIALLPLAFALGYTYLQRRSYITVILVHFFFNAFNLLLAVLMMM